LAFLFLSSVVCISRTEYYLFYYTNRKQSILHRSLFYKSFSHIYPYKISTNIFISIFYEQNTYSKILNFFELITFISKMEYLRAFLSLTKSAFHFLHLLSGNRMRSALSPFFWVILINKLYNFFRKKNYIIGHELFVYISLWNLHQKCIQMVDSDVFGFLLGIYWSINQLSLSKLIKLLCSLFTNHQNRFIHIFLFLLMIIQHTTSYCYSKQKCTEKMRLTQNHELPLLLLDGWNEIEIKYSA
jgi:hypothetical protein